MKDVPNVCITVAQPGGVGIPDRYTICEIEGLWITTVEHWQLRHDDVSYEHNIDYICTHPSLPDALEALRELGHLYGSWEVVEYATSLIQVIRN